MPPLQSASESIGGSSSQVRIGEEGSTICVLQPLSELGCSRVSSSLRKLKGHIAFHLHCCEDFSDETPP